MAIEPFLQPILPERYLATLLFQQILINLAYLLYSCRPAPSLKSAFWDTIFASKLRNRDSRIFFVALMGELKTLIRRPLRWFGGFCRRGGSVGILEAL